MNKKLNFKGNFGTLILSVSEHTASGFYQNGGELSGEFINNSFNGKWKNKGFEGLIEFSIINDELIGTWKKGLDKGPMKGKWKGKLIKEDPNKNERSIELPQELINQIIELENPDESLFAIIRYAKTQNFDNYSLIQYFNQILELKPNGTLAGEFALRLFNLRLEEDALRIIQNESYKVGDDLDISYFSSHKKYILEHSSNCILISEDLKFETNDFKNHLKRNPRFISMDKKPMKLVVKFIGRLHQIYLCNNSENAAIKDISQSDLNVHHIVNKIDADNLIRIELNGTTIYESTIVELGLGPSELNEYEECLQFNKTMFLLRKQLNFSEKSLKDISEFNEEFNDYEGIYLSENNMLLIEGSVDSAYINNVPASNRFSYMNYGKYSLQTTAIEVDDFRITDIILVKDYNMDDFEASAEGIPYCLSEVIHNKEGHLELLVDYFDIKDAWARDYWIGDF